MLHLSSINWEVLVEYLSELLHLKSYFVELLPCIVTQLFLSILHQFDLVCHLWIGHHLLTLIL